MPAKSKHCLLVVDDEPDLVQSVKDLLRFDFRVIGTTRAADGLRIIENEEVHVVMTDQRMPEMTGVEFLMHLRQSRPDTVRLLFTAYADLEAVIDAINQGNVYRYIAKPWEPQELRAILKQAVEHYELQAERRRLLLDLERANQDLRLANDLKRAFIKVASHELRTPLTMVSGLSELGCLSDEVAQPARGWFGQIRAGSHRLGDRLDQMEKLLQAERFERPLHPKPLDLGQLLRDAAGGVDTFIQRRKQTLQVDVPSNVGEIVAEEAKLFDCVVQLLMNAIKFTPDHGVIHLKGERMPQGGARIQVRDTGVGIAREALPQLFEPFFTGIDVSRHSSGTFEFDRRGLGLGLSVVKAFVEMHRGQVTVESTPGQGTTFTILLP